MHYLEQFKETQRIPPLNGFDEMIELTDEKKLWKFPIDNEQGNFGFQPSLCFEESIFFLCEKFIVNY